MTGTSCDVYWAHLDELRPRHLELLSDGELARRAAYRRDRDQARFALAAAMARLVIASRLGIAPRDVEVDRTCERCGQPHGRPRLPGHELHLSVTHSGDLAALAVSTAGPVGIDLEVVRPLDHQALLDEALAPEERAGPVSPHAFFTTWTRKESVLKATGAGLSVPMRGVVVTPPVEPPRLLDYPGTPRLPAQMLDLALAPGYAGAVTVLSDQPVTFGRHHASGLLRVPG